MTEVDLKGWVLEFPPNQCSKSLFYTRFMTVSKALQIVILFTKEVLQVFL